MPAAALVVHQLRYWLTYGAQAGNQLSGTGHGYLDVAVPWIVMVTALGAGTFAVRRRVGARRSFVERWLGASFVLVALFTVQEMLEGVFATGHPGGIAGVFGHGGWVAIPVALVVGLAIAFVLRVADALARTPGAPPATRGLTSLFEAIAVAPLRVRPLATAAAGRAPPGRPR